MTTLTLHNNQAALVFDVSPDGELNVEAAFPKGSDEAGNMAAAVCTAIGKKLATDEKFQAEIMDSI